MIVPLVTNNRAGIVLPTFRNKIRDISTLKYAFYGNSCENNFTKRSKLNCILHKRNQIEIRPWQQSFGHQVTWVVCSVNINEKLLRSGRSMNLWNPSQWLSWTCPSSGQFIVSHLLERPLSLLNQKTMDCWPVKSISGSILSKELRGKWIHIIIKPYTYTLVLFPATFYSV